MIKRLLAFSIRQRVLILAAAVLLLLGGVAAFRRLPIDAVPDVTTNQVAIDIGAPGLAPAEVESLVTTPIETAIGGLPHVVDVRSLSQTGLSQVTVVFDDSVDIYFARQLVQEKLTVARQSLPPNVRDVEMTPVSTGLGQIYQYTLDSNSVSPADLQAIQEFLVRPQLRTVPGVADVNTLGGYPKQYIVDADPARLLAHDITLRQLSNAITRNNANAGGGFIVHGPEQFLVREVGIVHSSDDIGDIVVAAKDGTPIYVRDVADVHVGGGLRQGAATHNGHETVLGVVMLLKGANTRTVSRAVDAKVRQIRKELPPGVRLTTVYNRSDLVDKTIRTVVRNLFEGGMLVVAVLLLLLGNARGALIVASVIPLSMLFAVIGMNEFGISANLLSLGAIDFGMIVDGGVVLVENTVRRLAEARDRAGEPLSRADVARTVLSSAREVGAPLTFGVSIIIMVYLPIMTLQGVEGKMFRPMAYTVALALAGALLLTLTLVPALCAFGLSRNTREKSNPFMAWAERLYRPSLGWALAHPRIVIAASAVLFAGCVALFPLLGSEFIPQLQEGALTVTAVRLPGVSLGQSVAMLEQMEKTIKGFPEVRDVYTQIGSFEIALDPDPPSVSDAVITLTPRRDWPRGMTQEKLADEIADRLRDEVPGQSYSFSQPIQMRTAELVSGVKADVAVKVFGPDTDMLNNLGGRLTRILNHVPGMTDISAEQTTGLPTLQIAIDRDAAARYGVDVSDIEDALQTAVAGKKAGQVVDGNEHFDIVVKLPESLRDHLAAIQSVRIGTPDGGSVPISDLARFTYVSSPMRIDHEFGERLVTVQANVRGRDLGSCVADARVLVSRQLKLPPGYHLEWGGQYENLQRARARLLVVVPLALAMILLLLYMTFGSFRQALIVFTGVPLAVTGGVLALLIRHMPFSISAGVGFIALFGVAVLNGVVLVSAINARRRHGDDIRTAVRAGALSRLRPVLMTALVAGLGFIPMALSTNVGAEVQRPLATVVIGGILSSTLLTLFVLPTLYALFERNAPRSNVEVELPRSYTHNEGAAGARPG